MGAIQSIEFEGNRYQLSAGDPVSEWILKRAGRFNQDGDGILSEKEIKEGLLSHPLIADEWEQCLGESTAPALQKIRKFLNSTKPLRQDQVYLSARQFHRFSKQALGEILKQAPSLDLNSESAGSEKGVRDQMRFFCQNFSPRLGRFSFYHYQWCQDLFHGSTGIYPRYTKVYVPEIPDQEEYTEWLPIIPWIWSPEAPFVSGGEDNPLLTAVMLDDQGKEIERRKFYLKAGSDNFNGDIFDYAISVQSGYMNPFYSAGIAFVKKYQADFDQAAAILAAHHTEIHPDNLRIMLYKHFVRELIALSIIDAWQDVSACADVGCSMEQSFRRGFPEFDNSVSRWSWKLATIRYQNRQKQGYGPGQTILGLALEAAADSRIALRYSGILSEAELTDEDEALKALLDPKKAITYRALIYDFLLTRLEETLFKDSRVAFPSDQYPYLVQSTSREMALIEAAQRLSIQPERDKNMTDQLIFGATLSYWTEFFEVGAMLGVKSNLPGVVHTTEVYGLVSLLEENDHNFWLQTLFAGSVPFQFIRPENPALQCREKTERIMP